MKREEADVQFTLMVFFGAFDFFPKKISGKTSAQ